MMATLAACDTGDPFTLSATSSASRSLVVRITLPGRRQDTIVPSGVGGLIFRSGAPFAGRVEIVDPETCQVREIVESVPPQGDIYIFFDDRAPATVGEDAAPAGVDLEEFLGCQTGDLARPPDGPDSSARNVARSTLRIYPRMRRSMASIAGTSFSSPSTVRYS